MKRCFDFAVSFLSLIIGLPILIVVAIGVYLQDRGPVFFKQKRVGLNRKPFFILKFRSMFVDAEKRGGFSTEDNDPRITTIGKMIRKSSLDEVPQLINVLKGEMSLVGPRPDVPEQECLYSAEEWRQRCSVRPGITGLAQATLRSSCTPEKRKELDLLYVREHTFLNDMKIILLTIKQVLLKGGN
jgi:lipopolysaccharide/colanic/teichoic acid biosynthesis glycosyltransferase